MKKKILFTGDSITDANRLWDDDPKGLGTGYVKMISEKIGEERYEIVNKGYNGFTASDMAERWEQICLTQNPDILNILVGINDVGYGISNDFERELLTFQKDYEFLVSSAREKTNARIVLLTPFVFPQMDDYAGWMEYLEDFVDIILKIAEKYHTDLIDLKEIFLQKTEKFGYNVLTTDGIHLKEFGNEIIRDAWLEWFEK